MTKASEAIEYLGKTLYKDFSIQKEPHYTIYKNVYENFASSLFENGMKGILLIGMIGVGKSALMRIMQKLFKDTKSRFKWVGANEFKFILEEYSVSEIMAMYGKNTDIDLYIDDIGIGASSDYKKFGNSINIISEIIYERYELFLQSGIRTHISSNLPKNVDKVKFPNTDSLLEIYGERVTDRLNEMCETIVITGKSLRK